MDVISRIADLCGDPNRDIFSAPTIANAYDSASLKFRDENNRCYSAAAELLTIDMSRLIKEYGVKQDGTGVETDTMQNLSEIIAARKTQINAYNAAITSERQTGSISSFAICAAKTMLPGINC